MMDSVNLQSGIHEKRLEIDAVKLRIEDLKKNLKAAEGQLTELELDLATLERATAILQGARPKPPLIDITTLPQSAPTYPPPQIEISMRRRHRKSGVALLVHGILKEAMKPMKAEDILPLLIEKRQRMGKASPTMEGMTGVLYRAAKEKVVFTNLGDRVFGLIEWDEK